jgi:hypothetical protein
MTDIPQQNGGNAMKRRMMWVTTGLICTLACTSWLGEVLAQPEIEPNATNPRRQVILEIDVEKQVDYISDVFNYAMLATSPNVTTPLSPLRTFGMFVNVADIVAVNGKPARGTATSRQIVLRLTPAPTSGQTIADTTRTAMLDFMWEILDAESTPIGSIMASGMNFGTPPPGAPQAVLRDNIAITGGTGAFLGVRGQVGSGPNITPARPASVTEDPANRRTHPGGGARRVILHLIPLARPEVVVSANRPLILHADFSAVTETHPARAGELLIAAARYLGPTRPGVNSGPPSPSTLQEVNSPVEVMLNGRSAQLVNKVAWPGSVDTYRLDFLVPEGTAPGLATIQLSAAWVAGPVVQIPVR